MKMQQDFITFNHRPSLKIEQVINKLKMKRAKIIVNSYNLFKQFVNIRIFLDSVFMFQEYDQFSQTVGYEPGYAVSNMTGGLDDTYHILGGEPPREDIVLNCIFFQNEKLDKIIDLAISSGKIGMVVLNTPEHQSMLVFSGDDFYLVNEVCVQKASRDQIGWLLTGHDLDDSIPFAHIQIYFPLNGLVDSCYKGFQELQESFHQEVQSEQLQEMQMICGEVEHELRTGFHQKYSEEINYLESQKSAEGLEHRLALLKLSRSTLDLILRRYYKDYVPMVFKSQEIRTRKLENFQEQLQQLHCKKSGRSQSNNKRKSIEDEDNRKKRKN